MFVDADTRIYRYVTPKYHVGLNPNRGIVVLDVDIFRYLRKQTGIDEFIPCSDIRINSKC